MMNFQESMQAITNESQLVRIGKLVIGIILFAAILFSFCAGATLVLERLLSEINAMPPVEMGSSLAGLR